MNNYKVIFKGELTSFANKEEILDLLSQQLNISQVCCRKLFNGNTYTFKEGISSEQADKLYNQLFKIGLITHIVDTNKSTQECVNNKNVQLNKYWSNIFKLFEAIQEKEDQSFYSLLKSDKAKKLSRQDARKISSNLIAIIFGPLYYLFKGMWAKGVILIILSNLFTIFCVSVEILINQSLPVVIYWLPMNIICSSMVNYDYYKYIKFNEKIWRGLPILFKNLWILVFICLITFLGSLAIANYSPDTDEFMLENIDGIWQTSDGSEIVKIELSTNHRLVIANNNIPVSIVDIDHDSNIVSLAIKDPVTNKKSIWALRQMFDDDGSFTLNLTLHDGQNIELEFVRRL